MLKLFYSPGACSLAPHVVLEELALEYEGHPVLIAEGENLSEEYLKINPRGRVPTLIAHGTAITEVPAILTYLASLKPEAGLVPPYASLDLAKTYELVAWLSSTLHIAYAQLWRPERFLPEGAEWQVLVDHARRRRALKRDGLASGPVSISGVAAPRVGADPVDVLDLDNALTALAELDPRQADEFQARVLTVNGAAPFTVDLETQRISGPDGPDIEFDIPAADRMRLIEGLDDIGLTLKHRDEIVSWEGRMAVDQPWLQVAADGRG